MPHFLLPIVLLAVLGVGIGVSATPVTKRAGSVVQKAAEPVVIDSAGIYIRASPLNTGNGHIIAGYAAQDGNQHVLRAARSTDNGQSWIQLGEVTRGDSATHDIDNAMPLQLPSSGRILYAFRNHDKAATGRLQDGSVVFAYTHYRITICYSDNGGLTWQFLSQVDERTANMAPGMLNGLWEPFLRIARDGTTLQCYYSAENDSGDQDNLMRYSRDGGKTWSAAIIVSGGDRDNARDGMTGVAEVDASGKLVCVFESYQDGYFSINRVLSHDDGYTWGERARVYTAAGGKDAGAPQVYNVGGTLVTSFMTNEAVDVGHVDGGQMKVVTSTNGAQKWSSMGQDGTVTADAGSHWPGLYTIDESHFLALYSKDGLGAVSQLYKLV
ncbi:glycoside hydrolase family 93 protein [Apodospora peruviana]|uniref:Glycoside hydrolase family 93 protein n=1 Tax=Apodospora peruviana TaxID=516989 RepID=A0AAE0I2H0_9PEZI|nr:glycoside hydrolase family 93 protein [Apodospora peruviana]